MRLRIPSPSPNHAAFDRYFADDVPADVKFRLR